MIFGRWWRRPGGKTARAMVVAAAGLAGCAAASAAPPLPAPIALLVDARDAPRGIIHAHLVFPVRSGPLTLVYPKWIPGHHRPTGPIINLSGLMLAANGRPLPWRRDRLDMYAFHCTVPPGAVRLTADLDFLLAPDPPGFQSDVAATANLADITWSPLLLYPAGRPAAVWTYAVSLRLPPGWHFGTALPVARQADDAVVFQPVPLTTLIDSPLVAGAFSKTVPLTGSRTAPVHEIDLFADSEAALEMAPQTLAGCRRLVSEAYALFGARHYGQYHWLVTLSDHVGGFGLEHHESSDDRLGERSLSEPFPRWDFGGLLAHEYVHSWNGKFRRPAGLTTTDYQQPMQGDLLWVYEGLTEYLGVVLAARSGLSSDQQFRENLAAIAASLDHRPGRQWRPLVDTAVSVQMLSGSPRAWRSLRRGTDYYDEGVLLWLEADTLIRRQTGGRRSLDDFCRRFFGPPSGPPVVRTYTFDEVVQSLHTVAPYDWRGFFRDRVYRITPHPPLAGIAVGGWKLVYTDRPNEIDKGAEGAFHYLDLSYSLGLSLSRAAAIRDVIPGMPGADAGLAPGMTVLGVNGRRFTNEGLLSALRAGKTNGQALELIVENGDFLKTYTLNYHGGLLYPHLERDPSRPDLLARIAGSRTPISGEPKGAPTPL